MYKRLYRHLTASIRSARIAPGQRLPSSRELAEELGIARNTVVSVYHQLLCEGFTESRVGNGTFVSEQQQDVYPASVLEQTDYRPGWLSAQLSERGNRIVEEAPASPSEWGAFMPGVPDVEQFPHATFSRLLRQAWRAPMPEMLSYSQGGGLKWLREELAAYLGIARSVQCDPDQIIITEGVHQAIDLVTRMLGSPQDVAWVEDPGYWGARTILAANGISTVPIPVDAHGMCIPPAASEPTPKFIFVTPSHQYPLGMVMSLDRRRRLIRLARHQGSWIIEDDYDSEFRFGGLPVPALQGLEPNAPVIYMGTFSKTMYPGLRLSYVVLPKVLASALKAAHTTLYREGRLLTQAAVAAFISEGHYTSHILRMRKAYAGRRRMLVSLIERRLGPGWLTPEADNAGLHLVVSLPETLPDTRLVELARSRGILTRSLSRYYHQAGAARQGLLLGYACVPEHQIIQQFEVLLDCIAQVMQDGASGAGRVTSASP
nr:PLP-dependent aminotransferase family protein [Castellaniella sp.]